MSFQVDHSRPLDHWSDKIKGEVCNGCLCMEVIPRQRRWYRYEEYYCSKRHEMVDPFGMECGKRVDAPQNRPGAFPR